MMTPQEMLEQMIDKAWRDFSEIAQAQKQMAMQKDCKQHMQ
jgi:hypothetical protein